jgi:hypothetical protein
MPTIQPRLDPMPASRGSTPRVWPRRADQVTSSPARNAVAVDEDPQRRSAPIRLRGDRLRINAPTTPNIPNAITKGICSASDSSLTVTRTHPTAAIQTNPATANQGQVARSGARSEPFATAPATLTRRRPR